MRGRWILPRWIFFWGGGFRLFLCTISSLDSTLRFLWQQPPSCPGQAEVAATERAFGMDTKGGVACEGGAPGGQMTFSCKPPHHPREEGMDNKETARQTMTFNTCMVTEEKQGAPHPFLTSSQYSPVWVVTRLSLMLAGATTIHKLLVGGTVLFCTFAVPLAFSPEPNTFLKHLSAPPPSPQSYQLPP